MDKVKYLNSTAGLSPPPILHKYAINLCFYKNIFEKINFLIDKKIYIFLTYNTPPATHECKKKLAQSVHPFGRLYAT